MQQPTPISSERERGRLARRDRISPVLLCIATLSVLADKVTGLHGFAVPALAAILLTGAANWPRLKRLTRIMIALSATGALIFALTGGTSGAFMLAASRALFLPALLTVMMVLQVAAQKSEPIERVARFVVDQPPRRRFGMLALAGHIFGIFLNIAGYRFLLTIALDQCRQLAPDARVLSIQERRVTSAILCGFGATILWSPVGIALNLIIPLMPDFSWLDYAPYGLGAMVCFVALRFLFDWVEPKPKVPFQARPRERALPAILSLVALLLGITGLAAAAEAVLRIPMQAALLISIPLGALLWRIRDRPHAPATAAWQLGRETLGVLSQPVNEVCLLLASGFLGLILVEIIPPDLVRNLVTFLNLPPAGIATLIVLIVGLTSQIGINPMISGTLCVGAVLAAHIHMPPPMLILATMTGWSIGMVLSPVTATVVVTSAILGRPAREVGLRWNGPFVVTFAALMVLVFFVWGQFL